MSLFLFTSTILLTISNAYTYSITVCAPTTGTCRVTANSSSVIIADKTVNTLEILCEGQTACQAKSGLTKGLIVYSSANNTLINCIGKDSCDKITSNFGLTPPLTFGNFSPNSFENIIRETATILCIGEQACKESKSIVNGTIKQGFKMQAGYGSEIIPNQSVIKGTLMKSEIKCNSNLCQLDCANSISSDTCKDTKCLENTIDSCNCLGICPLDLNTPNVPSPIPMPTSPIVPVPTYKPTPQPTDNRTIVNCETDPCILIPNQNWDINCGSRVEECNIQCKTSENCQDGVIIETKAAFTNLECRTKNGCDKVKLYVNGGKEVNINCWDEISCTHMEIIVENPLTIVNINIFGKEGFKNGVLYCNGKCNLVCQGIDSCKSTRIECNTNNIINNCQCIGEYCNNNEMIPFGDMTCIGKEERCIIPGSGDLLVIADKTVNELIIDCSEPNQCKKIKNGLRIYSAALKTTINCGMDGCEEILVNIGNLKGNKIPKGFKESDFERDFNTSIGASEITSTITCNAIGACKKAKLYYSDSVTFADIIGGAEDALLNADIECDNCKRLQVSCPPFNGCLGASLVCTNPLNCNCIPIEPEITIDENNSTTVPPLVPVRVNTCPEIVNPLQSIIGIKKGNVGTVNGSGLGVNDALKIVIPFGVVIVAVMFCFGFAWFNLNKNNKNNNGFRNGLNRNDNVNGGYSVEMH